VVRGGEVQCAGETTVGVWFRSNSNDGISQISFDEKQVTNLLLVLSCGTMSKKAVKVGEVSIFSIKDNIKSNLSAVHQFQVSIAISTVSQ